MLCTYVYVSSLFPLPILKYEYRLRKAKEREYFAVGHEDVCLDGWKKIMKKSKGCHLSGFEPDFASRCGNLCTFTYS
jgi:hypothetical protein